MQHGDDDERNEDDDELGDERDLWVALFKVADECIAHRIPVFPAAVYELEDGTLAKRPLTTHGHLNAHLDPQLIRQQLLDPPHIPASLPDGYTVVVACVPGQGGFGVLDCDVKHGAVGKQTLAALVAEYGEFYKAVWSTPSGGANIVFEKPKDATFGNQSPWTGIDVRADNGWVVAPGNGWVGGGEWRWKVGNFGTVAPLPDAMVAQLTPAANRGLRASNAATVAFVEASPHESTLPVMQAFSAELTRFRSSGSGSRHDALVRVISWACGMNALDLRWAIEQIKDEWEALTAGEGREDEVTEVLTWVAGQELAKAAANPAPLVVARPVVVTESSAPSVSIADYQVNLPEEFWQRPLHAEIRAWSHSRQRSADAVFACVRARFCVTVPWSLRVDTGIGAPLTLNSLTALVADSGVGKSSAMALAEEVLPLTGLTTATSQSHAALFVGPLGSGEGLTEAYYGDDMAVNPNTGKNEKVRKRVRDAALFDLDEGEAMTQMGARSGSILLPELRKAFSGRGLGQSNASSLTRRTLAANTYRLVLIVGLQPQAAMAVLADAGTGTPQRFVLFNAGDPSIPEHAPVVPLPVLPAPPPTINVAAQVMTADPAVLAEIRAQDLAVQQGRAKLPELDSQRPANRIKEAALLALLDGRSGQITEEDWMLAGMVMRTSDAIRSAVLSKRAEADAAAAQARGHREAVVEGAKDRQLVSELSERLLARVVAAGDEGATRKALREALVSSTTKHRFQPALDGLVHDGTLVIDPADGRIKVRKMGH